MINRRTINNIISPIIKIPIPTIPQIHPRHPNLRLLRPIRKRTIPRNLAKRAASWKSTPLAMDGW